jgi:alpha,alpha-trehalase
MRRPPAGEFRASRRYVDQTMMLETTFTTAGGTAVLPDGLAGEEGAFLLCTFWQAQALAGQVEAATATFERAVAAINDVGLLAEEAGPASSQMAGNFPQAFSHIGLINAAWAITRARQLTSG